jgi:hypothetical protein
MTEYVGHREWIKVEDETGIKEWIYFCRQDCADFFKGFIALQPNIVLSSVAEIEQHVKDKMPGYRLRKSWIDETTKLLAFEVIGPEPKKGMKYEQPTVAARIETKSLPSVPADGLVSVRRPGHVMPPRPKSTPTQGTLW